MADDADEIDVELSPGGLRCEQCQSVMGHDDIFCGECGFVSRSITRAFSISDFTGETRQLDLSPVRVESPPPVRAFVEEPEGKPEPTPEPTPEPQPEPEPDPGLAPEPDPEFAPEAEAEQEPNPVLVLPPASLRRAAPRTPPAPVGPPTTSTASPRRFRDTGEYDDFEATRIVSRVSGDRYVLQFSTGESFTVYGSGLIGRNPQPEPGEFFEHLVRILDTGKSVSKTHLEFGQEGGAFWVKDRFSGNGTIIREPELSPRRAKADRRYRVIRGTRIDIGEQFFVIS